MAAINEVRSGVVSGQVIKRFHAERPLHEQPVSSIDALSRWKQTGNAEPPKPVIPVVVD